MPTISQRIALEGGEEIRRQLQAMGKAGEASFEQIEAAGVSLAQSLDRVIRSVARLEASFVALKASASGFSQSVGRMGAAFGAFESAVVRSARTITLLGAAVGAATVGFGALVKGAANAADNIGEQAAGLGLTTDRYQELAAAATDSGIDQEKFGRGLGNLAKKVQEGDKTLRRLGITGRTVDEAFLQLADVFARLPDGVKKTSLAMEIFGARMGRAFIDMLNKGRAGIEELGSRFAAMKFTEPEIKIGDELSKQFIILGFSATQAFNKLALLFGPQMSRVLGGLSDMVIAHFPRISQTIEGFVRDSIEPAITDLFRLLNGDVMEIKTPWMVELGIKFFELKNIIVQAGEFIAAAFQKLRSAADSAAGIFNRIFGTNISGDALLLAAAVLKVTGILSVFTGLVTAAGTAMLVLVTATGLAIRAIGLFGAGVATLTTVLSAAGLGGAVGALVRILAGLAALVFTPAGVIAGLGLITAAFLFTSEETQRTWLAMFASLGQSALSALTGIAQTIRAALNIRPDATLFEGIAAAAGATVGFIFDAFANLGQSINRIFKSLEGPLNEFFANLGPQLIGSLLGSMASLLPAVLNVGLTIGKLLGQGITRAITEVDPTVIFDPIIKAMQEAGGPAGKAFADAFLGQLQGVRKEAAALSGELERSWKPGADPGAAFQAADSKASSLTENLKRLGTTLGSMPSTFDRVGRAGSQAFQSIKQAAEEAAVKIADINARSASSMGDLRDEARRLAREQQKQTEAGQDTTEIDERLATVHRKMRELGEGRVRQVEAVAQAEQQNVDALKRQNAELALQERMRQQAEDAERFRGRPLGAPEGFQPGAAPAQLIPVPDFSTLNDQIIQTAQDLGGLGDSTLQASTAADNWTGVISDAGSALQTAADEFASAIPPAAGENLDDLQSSTAVVDRAFGALKQAADSAAQSLNTVDAPESGFATGGLVRGKPGRDSNLAWLTDKEFVMRVPAVRKYGVNFMRAINSGQFKLPKFNLGGLVDGMTQSLAPLALPRFAEGGMVSGGGRALHPVALSINGGAVVHVQASGDAVEQMRRAASNARSSSTGVKPDWYR